MGLGMSRPSPGLFADEQEFTSASRFEFDKDLNHSPIAALVELTDDVARTCEGHLSTRNRSRRAPGGSSAISLLLRSPVERSGDDGLPLEGTVLSPSVRPFLSTYTSSATVDHDLGHLGKRPFSD